MLGYMLKAAPKDEGTAFLTRMPFKVSLRVLLYDSDSKTVIIFRNSGPQAYYK